MFTAVEDTPIMSADQDREAKTYAEKLLLSLGYNDAICTAMEFQWFNVAEELRFMQDDYRSS